MASFPASAPRTPAPGTPVATFRFNGRADLAAALALWLADALRRDSGRYLALAVGDSTLPLYAALATHGAAWPGKRILPLDELVPRPGERSFSSRLRAALPPALRPLVTEIEVEPDPDRSARALGEMLARDGLCAAVLGLGPDGHIAFNQPGSDLASVSRVVELTPENRARADLAPRALTPGVATIMRAGSLALVASGPGKRRALRRVLEGPEGPDVPASWLRLHPSLTVFVDEASCD